LHISPLTCCFKVENASDAVRHPKTSVVKSSSIQRMMLLKQNMSLSFLSASPCVGRRVRNSWTGVGRGERKAVILVDQATQLLVRWSNGPSTLACIVSGCIHLHRRELNAESPATVHVSAYTKRGSLYGTRDWWLCPQHLDTRDHSNSEQTAMPESQTIRMLSNDTFNSSKSPSKCVSLCVQSTCSLTRLYTSYRIVHVCADKR
jgi:hypothetical protein